MKKLLPTWVYRNLNEFGNCAISVKRHKKLGTKRILKELKSHGLDCRIRPMATLSLGKYDMASKINETYVIIEVI